MSLTVGELQGMLDGMSWEALGDLRTLVEHAMAAVARRKLAADIMATAMQSAKVAGLTLEDLRQVPDQPEEAPKAAALRDKPSGQKPEEPSDTRSAGRRKRSRTTQYVNPANSNQVWKGKGRRPAWLAAQLKNGKGLETFRTSSRH
jgi:DNA-binding protein H-NS